MAEIFVGVGSNEDRANNIRRGLEALGARFGRLRTSPVYESGALGGAGADYFNLVIAFDCNESAEAVFDALKAIEAAAGRRRNPEPGLCTLDLDLLTCGDVVMQSDRFSLPRSDILEHAFVLRPLAALAPWARHPLTRQTYHELWAAMAPQAPALVEVAL